MEERRERVEIFLGDRVELVVVTRRATGGQTEPDGGGGVDTVLGVNGIVFLSDRAALAAASARRA